MSLSLFTNQGWIVNPKSPNIYHIWYDTEFIILFYFGVTHHLPFLGQQWHWHLRLKALCMEIDRKISIEKGSLIPKLKYSKMHTWSFSPVTPRGLFIYNSELPLFYCTCWKIGAAEIEEALQETLYEAERKLRFSFPGRWREEDPLNSFPKKSSTDWLLA